ncbi:hypothetical protein HDU98_004425 [Podochytrium sp. JEL0797]|nr:hypothetical protein HDU98_004425 [Podochytrium sp. JEL0797]
MDVNNTTATLRRLDDSEAGTFARAHAPASNYNESTRPLTDSGGSQGSLPRPSLVARVLSLDRWAKAAMAWALLQLVVLLIAEGLVLQKHLAEMDQLRAINATNPDYLLVVNQTTTSIIGNAEAITIYEGIYMAAQVFLVYLSFDAIITSSKIQLIASTIFNLALCGYSIQQYFQSADLVTENSIGPLNFGFIQGNPWYFVPHHSAPYEIAVIILGAVFLVGWCCFATKLNVLFGWNVFKGLGADVEVRKRLHLYHVYMLLLKIDVFFFLSFVVQYILLVFGDTPSTAKTVNMIFSPLGVLVLLLMAYFAVTRESNVLMTFLLIGLSGGIGYLVDRLIDIWTVTDSNKYRNCKTSLTLFTALTLVAALATFAAAVLNFLNFGKGLMQSLNNQNTSRKTPVSTIDRSHELNHLGGGGNDYGAGRSYGTSLGATGSTLNRQDY